MRIYLESYGCSQNQGEGETILRDLRSAGHVVANDPRDADVGILVSCAVIGSTESRMVRRWRAMTELIPNVIVTGCLVPVRADRLQGPGRERTTFVPIREQHRIAHLLLPTPAPSTTPTSVDPDGTQRSSAHEEVVIAQGCTSACTYCLSRLARGRLASVSSLEILHRIHGAVSRGAVEVRLTSLDTSAWGIDLASRERLPDLLRLVAGLPGEFQIRVGMMSPQTLREIARDYFDALSGPRFFQFLHLPVQSGSDRVLSAMRRGYASTDFVELVRSARSRVKDLMISTDFIVGFPGETEDDFEASCAVLRTIAPEVANITRFSPRPGTPAARFPAVPAGIAKRRSRVLSELRAQIGRERLEEWIGREVEGIVVEHGPDGSSVARLGNYLPVVLPKRLALGAKGVIRIDGARTTYLLGRALGPARFPPESERAECIPAEN